MIRSKNKQYSTQLPTTRREIMRLLVDSELPIASIARRFPINRTAVNKNFHVLSGAGLLHSRKAGRETLYTFEPDPLFTVRQWLSYYERYWEDRFDALRRYVEPDAEQKRRTASSARDRQ